MSQHIELSLADARRLLMSGAGLLHSPATPPSLPDIIRQLAFLQLDSINYVERAHELTLHTRSNDYDRADIFKRLNSRSLFEHWTHDASLIPIEYFPHWHYRFHRYKTSGWHISRLGDDADKTIRQVLGRITKHGPLMSRDFEDAQSDKKKAGGGWWNWKPAKAALEYLWRTGRLAVSARTSAGGDAHGFEKVYDLATRVHPDALTAKKPTPAQHLEWACHTALARLGLATPKEIADFWRAVPVTDVRRWVDTGLRSGRLTPVQVDGRLSVASHNIRDQLAALPDAPPEARLLSPFDPLIRDRDRALRLFNFHYRFEAFTPAAKRVHGYYVLPVLMGDKLITRLDARFDRATSTLHTRQADFEKGIRPTRVIKSSINAATERLAAFIGAKHVARHTSAAPHSRRAQ